MMEFPLCNHSVRNLCIKNSFRTCISGMTIFIALLLLLFPAMKANFKCSEGIGDPPKYYLIEKCQRSTLSIVASANFKSVSSCHRYGRHKKGLALNFSPPEATKSSKVEVQVPEYNCEVLKCPEFETGVSLVNDTRYDYYSLYARPMPDVNASCVPGVGMVMVFKQKLNYSQTVERCTNRSGHLADITSELRTDSFAQVLFGAGVEAAYVGMTRDNGSVFTTISGDTLDCMSYRAWAPGHPKRHKKKMYGCVVTTRARTWRTVSCESKLPSLCELIPKGPYIIGSMEAAKTQNDTTKIQNATETPTGKQ